MTLCGGLPGRARRAAHWERFFFLLATILILLGAALCTWARATKTAAGPDASNAREGLARFIRYPKHLGDMLFSIGIASLAPLSGALLLVGGEAIRLILILRKESSIRDAARGNASSSLAEPASLSLIPDQSRLTTPAWGRAFRHEAVRWGIFLTMVVFTATLVDGLAEMLAGLCLLATALLNLPFFRANELSRGEAE